VVTWNVNGRVGSGQARQAETLLALEPDVIALQEVTAASYPAWRERLSHAGYSVLETIGLLALLYPEPDIRRKYCHLTASRHPIARLPGLMLDDPDEAAVAFPEKYLAATISVGGHDVDVHNAHLPPGSTRGVIKVHAFEAIRRRIESDNSRPRILCGDFNTPRSEADGDVETWAGTAEPS